MWQYKLNMFIFPTWVYKELKFDLKFLSIFLKLKFKIWELSILIFSSWLVILYTYNS